MARLAVIDGTGHVANIIEADPSFTMQGYTLVQTDSAGPGWTYANGTFTAPAAPPPTAQEQYAEAMAAGLTVTSTSTPALNGTYSVDTTAQQNIAAIVAGIGAGHGLPGGGSTMYYFDKTGAPHAFTADQISELGVAIRDYVYNLFLFANGAGALPSSSVTIA